MSTLNLLIVDDDSLVANSIDLILPDGWNLVYISNPNNLPEDRIFHAAFVDMHLTGNLEQAEGLELIPKIVQENPHIEVVAMSGNLDKDLMENCLKAGASRFLAKPLSKEEVLLTLDKIESLHLMKNLKHSQFTESSTWIGSGKLSQNVKAQIANFTGEKGPILIEGETGTGKEVAANLIHINGPSDIFIRVNIAAIPDSLFESEFFGHVRGAFTGANQTKIGLAEAAHGGDLFIDEIEALSLPLQVKLLRFLESGEVRRVGANTCTKVKTRIIVATNRNLEDMVEKGEFREDLLWRLNHQKITLPPLRERREDIEELANYFLANDKARKKSFTPDAISSLLLHHWPGNIRELKRVCEQLLLQAPLPFIRIDDIKKLLPEKPFNLDLDQNLSENLTDMSLSDIMTQFEAKILQKYLNRFSNDMQIVCDTLQVSRSNLYKKIKDYSLNVH
ncbi:MAG: sigma-54-dependent Fis family transcriptional regulator [Bdellovibrionaceae bacterium]|nr:sigma-54-dependent Fis family transcriptional regulator [Pseudobdellovibrionaceae bacterium]